MPPDSNVLHPLGAQANMVFLKPLLARHPEIANVSVGDYTYYSDNDDPLRFFERNILYNFGMAGARLDIGSYCAIAHGVRFLMPDANHVLAGPSTYPFPVFGGDWSERLPLEETPFPNKGAISVGHDVWLGLEATVLPGVSIGHGAVIGAKSVVASSVPPYAVAVGNPARVVRLRFSPEEIDRLLRMRWWDWPPEHIAAAVPVIVGGTVAELWNHYKRHVASDAPLPGNAEAEPGAGEKR